MYLFNSLDDYRDIETFNSYKQLVEIEKSVSHEDMLRYMRKSSRDNARTPMQMEQRKKMQGLVNIFLGL